MRSPFGFMKTSMKNAMNTMMRRDYVTPALQYFHFDTWYRFDVVPAIFRSRIILHRTGILQSEIGSDSLNNWVSIPSMYIFFSWSISIGNYFLRTQYTFHNKSIFILHSIANELSQLVLKSLLHMWVTTLHGNYGT